MTRAVLIAGILLSALTASADVLSSAVPVSDAATDNAVRYPNTGRKVATASNGTIYVLYYGATGGIRVARSTNRGQSFATSVQVDAASSEGEIAVDSAGIVHVAWGSSGSINYSRSTDGGATFSAAANVGSTTAGVHMAVDSPWVYLTPRNGSNLYRSGDSGATAFTATSTGGSWAFADVHVDRTNGDVVLVVDNPTVSFFTSSDHGATLNGPVTPGGSVFYSTAVFAATATNRYAYVGGSSNSGLRIDIDAQTSTVLTLGTTTVSQGRTLAVDAFNNVVDGYVDSGTVKFAVSTDNGDTFGTAVAVATADFLSVAINRFYGDIVVVYETGGEIFCTVYGSLILQPPSVTTAEVTGVAASAATGGGDVVADGGSAIVARGVCWNTTGDPTTSDSTATAAGSTGAFTAAITGLSPQTAYYVRAFATNATGTAYGQTVSFSTTANPTPPIIATAAATDVTTTGATCGGIVSSDGGADVSARGVCWSTSALPTIADAKTTDGAGLGTFASTLSNLSPVTTYFVRAYATNVAGVAYGDATTFTTAPLPVPPAEPVEPVSPPGAPDLQVAITAETASADVGDEVRYFVRVANVGTASAEDVVVRVALPPSVEFVAARLVNASAAQVAPLAVYLDGSDVVIELGEVIVLAESNIELTLRTKSSGKVSLVAAVTVGDSTTVATDESDGGVQVDDVYWEIVSTVAPLHVCGWMGLAPALLLLGLCGLKRRGSIRR